MREGEDVIPWGWVASKPFFIYWTRKVVHFNQVGSVGPLEETGRGQKDSGHRCPLVVLPEPRRHAEVLVMVIGKPLSG